MRLKTAYKAALILSLLVVITALPSGTSRLLLLLIAMAELALLFKRSIVDSQKKDWIKNTGMAAFSLLFLFLLLETCFMYVRRSNAFGDTMASRLWFDTYWKPINSYGFRDQEPAKGTGNDIFFIGDSFTAGHGIRNTADRFTDIVKDKLQHSGAAANVINLGKQGADTRDEFLNMTNFIKASGRKPAYIVLQYFGNDIEEVASQNGLKYTVYKPYQDLNTPGKYLVKRSFFLNYLYWMIPGRGYSSYFDFLQKGYASDSIFRQHEQDIRQFTSYAGENRIPILVVLFPFMQNTSLSKTVYMDKIEAWLTENNVRYVDVASLIQEIPAAERVVNGNDAHASVSVNRLVGNAIYQEIAKRPIAKAQ